MKFPDFTKNKIAFTVVALIAIFLVARVIFHAYELHVRPMIPKGSEPQTLIVAKGGTVNDFIKTLQQQGLWNKPDLLRNYAFRHGYADQMQYGEYCVTPGMSVVDLLRRVSTGKGVITYRATFIEGWTFADMKAALAERKKLIQTIPGKTDQQIMAAIEYPNAKPEGLFFPDTYIYRLGDSDIDILKQSYKKMAQVLNAQWQQRADGLPYKDAYEALIVASMLEKEASLPPERQLIAGVILFRIHKGMRLQIDPTVLYGLGKPYDTPITHAFLRKKTPYNTYSIFGLPPTPISNPGLTSIQAAFHPNQQYYLYYVARGDGTHVFSKTYAEHLKAISQYRATLREQDRLSFSVTPHYLLHSPALGFFANVLFGDLYV